MQLLGEGGTEAYYNNAILLTGFTGLITMIPCLYFYRKDRRARIAGGLVTGQKPNRLGIGECGLILVMGAGFAQFANMFVNMIGSFLNAEEYQETMSQLTDGKSMFFLPVRKKRILLCRYPRLQRRRAGIQPHRFSQEFLQASQSLIQIHAITQKCPAGS